jgi:hypothetical protein
MKKLFLSTVLLITILGQTSCSSDSSSSSSSSGTIDQSQINGWWYPGENNFTVYKAYYFGAGGEYKQDMTNFSSTLGIGLATWTWEASTIIKITPIAGSTIVGGPQTLEVTKLTQDSLVGNSSGSVLKLGRINHTP